MSELIRISGPAGRFEAEVNLRQNGIHVDITSHQENEHSSDAVYMILSKAQAYRLGMRLLDQAEPDEEGP